MEKTNNSELKNISYYRKAAGLTQRSMSDLFKIPKRTIENWENESREPSTWAKAMIIEKLQSIADNKSDT